MAALTIWLYGHQVAIVERERKNRLRLSYTEEALDTYEGGTPLLSLAFPLTRDRYPNGVTRLRGRSRHPAGGRCTASGAHDADRRAA